MTGFAKIWGIQVAGFVFFSAPSNASGMDVNITGVQYVVHYGQPSDLDTVLQQIGRAGRDGTQSHHLKIYH
jgi:ATP-dependent DNA helicase RecQ